MAVLCFAIHYTPTVTRFQARKNPDALRGAPGPRTDGAKGCRFAVALTAYDHHAP